MSTDAAPRILFDPQDYGRPTRIATFLDWCQTRHEVTFADAHDAWRWSVADVGRFWNAVAEYFDVFDPAEVPLADASMPGARWFPDVQLNYAAEALRRFDDHDVAIVHSRENGPAGEITTGEITAGELRRQVAALAHTLRGAGVGPGDRVAGYLPNIPAAIVGLLASASIGAVWTVCSPDFGVGSVVDRIGQVEPTVLIAADGYHFAGARVDRTSEARDLVAQLPTLREVVWVDHLEPGRTPDGYLPWSGAVDGDVPFVTEPVSFDHPLWIVYSSGTTGVPKGIVHGHGGVVLEQLKAIGLHADTGRGDRFFFFTSTAWMLWNMVASSLLTGATAVVHDGSPTHPGLLGQWRLASELRCTYFGTSAGILNVAAGRGLDPTDGLDLSAVRIVGSTGSPLSPAATEWFYDVMPSRVLLASSSGGTDVATGFVGGSPHLPVRAGELSGALLGVDVQSWDESGRRLIGQEGELVVTQPMPSMPVCFWADPDGTRYRDAYFDRFPGVWLHGDLVTETDHGSYLISGRSDATLNRHGVRMGTADVYAALDQCPEIADSVMVGVDLPDGSYWMPLFVALSPDAVLDEALRGRLVETIRERASARHVPDEIIEVPQVPRTRTGKRIEVPLKRILQGTDPDVAVSRDALVAPDSIDALLAHLPVRTS